MRNALLHYSQKPFKLKKQTYEQERNWQLSSHIKPNGLWVSVKGEHDWEAFCRGENFSVERLKNETPIIIKPDANILWVHGTKEFDAFAEKYGLDARYGGRCINWPKVAEDYDGIIIAPYIWERRLHESSSWYYGWDCASGCIWNLEAIEAWSDK
jgi:hypothetical protein